MPPFPRTPSLIRPDARRCLRPVLNGVVCLCIVLLGSAACTQQKIIPPPPVDPDEVVGYRTLGTWTGDASIFTETITSDSAAFRVHWQATAKSASAPDTGSLSVIFRSGDSGNPIINAVDITKPGEGMASVAAERPRWYYLDIQSADVNWTVRVEEPIYGSRGSGGSGKP